jgi:hypothetical protein
MFGIDQKDKWLWSAGCLAQGVAVMQADVLDKLLYSLILWYKELCTITWCLFAKFYQVNFARIVLVDLLIELAHIYLDRL